MMFHVGGVISAFLLNGGMCVDVCSVAVYVGDVVCDLHLHLCKLFLQVLHLGTGQASVWCQVRVNVQVRLQLCQFFSSACQLVGHFFQVGVSDLGSQLYRFEFLLQ